MSIISFGKHRNTKNFIYDYCFIEYYEYFSTLQIREFASQIFEFLFSLMKNHWGIEMKSCHMNVNYYFIQNTIRTFALFDKRINKY